MFPKQLYVLHYFTTVSYHFVGLYIQLLHILYSYFVQIDINLYIFIFFL